MTDIAPTTTIGDIVARDLRSAAVFARHGIDFCCAGRRSLADACQAHGVNQLELVRELDDLASDGTSADDATSWPLDRVVERILSHHAYVRRQIPLIQAYTHTLVAKKGAAHPVLIALSDAFDQLVSDLSHHLAKEESILFPYIDAMLRAQERGDRLPRTPFGTIQNPVRAMEHEHEHAGEDMRHIRTLTHDFTPPADACTTWRACYAELADFERDLHAHVHLENTVLFPAAARLEEDLETGRG